MIPIGIQSPREGVDVWKIPKPTYLQNRTKSFQNYPMNSDIAGVANLFVKNNSRRVSKKRRLFNQSSNDSIVSGLKELDHGMLCSTYKEGLLLEEGHDINKQIDGVIITKQYSSKSFL